MLGSEDVVSRSEQADLSEIPVGEGQTLRPAEESDAEAIAAVANAMSERLYGEAAVSPDEIRRWFAYTGLETRVVEMNGHVVGDMDVERRAGGASKWTCAFTPTPGSQPQPAP